MKILILSPTQPVPAISGDRIRIFNFLKHLSKRNNITLITLNHEASSYNAHKKDDLGNYCDNIYDIKHVRSKICTALKWIFSDETYRHVKFFNETFREKIHLELSKNIYDVVFCNFLDTAQYLRGMKLPIKSPLFVIDQHNADELWYQKFANAKSLLLRYFGKQNINRLRRCQSNDYKVFDLCLSVSEEDAEFTKNFLNDSKRVMVAPNGVDIDYFCSHSEHKSQNIVLFCGSMNLTMNQDAVLHFYNNIFPRIKLTIPDVQFIIVGRNPPMRIKRLNDNLNTFVTGTVNDVRPFYEKARAAVAPFRLGGGTKLKIAEAMAMKVPVVSTNIGCQGIKVENHKHIWIANDDFDFADRVIQALKETPMGMIEQAYRLVSKLYSWKGIVNKVENTINEMRSRKMMKL